MNLHEELLMTRLILRYFSSSMSVESFQRWCLRFKKLEHDTTRKIY
jgi:hypothetical protein